MYLNLALSKIKQIKLLKANEPALRNIFNQLRPVNNKLSFTEIALFYESLNIVPVIIN